MLGLFLSLDSVSLLLRNALQLRSRLRLAKRRNRAKGKTRPSYEFPVSFGRRPTHNKALATGHRWGKLASSSGEQSDNDRNKQARDGPYGTTNANLFPFNVRDFETDFASIRRCTHEFTSFVWLRYGTTVTGNVRFFSAFAQEHRQR